MKTNTHLPQLFLSGIASLLIATTLSPVTNAASSEKLTIGVSPVSKKYQLDSGTSKKDTITINNSGDTEFTFQLTVEPYSVKNDSYEPDYLTSTKRTDLKTWVSFDKTRYPVAARSKVEVPYTITVPANATPGGHYGVIFAETVAEKIKSDQPVLQQKSRIGAVIYATVNGNYLMGGKFNGIRTPGLQFKPPLKSEINVENTGNSDFAVKTVFAVTDIMGNRKYTQEKEYQLLPETKRKIIVSWDNSPKFGFFKVVASAKFLDQQTSHTSYVLMAPLAYYMIFVFGLLVAVIVFVAKRQPKS